MSRVFRDVGLFRGLTIIFPGDPITSPWGREHFVVCIHHPIDPLTRIFHAPNMAGQGFPPAYD